MYSSGIHPLRHLYHVLTFSKLRYHLLASLIFLFMLASIYGLLSISSSLYSGLIYYGYLLLLVYDLLVVLIARLMHRSFANPLEQVFAMQLPRFVVFMVCLVWDAFEPQSGALYTLAFFQGLGCIIYASGFIYEAGHVSISHQSTNSTKLSKNLKLAHLSDLHIARRSVREQKILDSLKAYQVDLILLSGDYLNLSHVRDLKAQEELVEFLRELRALAPVYACYGSPTVDPRPQTKDLLRRAGVVLLDDQIKTIDSDKTRLQIWGLECKHNQDDDNQRFNDFSSQLDPNLFSILLFHSPELAPRILSNSGNNPDLYLCGHTHGGQIRIPIWGALITSCHTGLRYQSGKYDLGTCLLYVSRGLGMEGGPAPRMRFFCPPELVFWSLISVEQSK